MPVELAAADIAGAPADPDAGDPLEPRVLRSRDAAELGISRGQLSGPLWPAVWRGVHRSSDSDENDPSVRIQAAGLLLPDGAALGGWAALHAWGVRDLDGRVGLGGTVRPIIVCVGEVGLMMPRSGLVVDRGVIPSRELSSRCEVAVVSPERAICQIARRDGVEYGLAAADATCRAGVTTPGRLREFVATQRGRPGVPAMRLVARLVDPRAASIPESHFRYIWVVLAGLPVPLVNASIVDNFGVVVGDPDLFDRDAALVGEYDGATHRELAAHTRDNNREEGFESRNLTVVRGTWIDVWKERLGLIRRLQDGHRRGMSRDRSRDNWGLRVR